MELKFIHTIFEITTHILSYFQLLKSFVFTQFNGWKIRNITCILRSWYNFQFEDIKFNQ